MAPSLFPKSGASNIPSAIQDEVCSLNVGKVRNLEEVRVSRYVSDWIWNSAPKLWTFALRYEGFEVEVLPEGRSLDIEFPRVGIQLPFLKTYLDNEDHRNYKVLWAVGINQKLDQDYELGSETDTPLWIGLSIHVGNQTTTQATHDAIAAALRPTLKITCPHLDWLGRTGSDVWSIWARVPTSVDSVVFSESEYIWCVTREFIESYKAVEPLLRTGFLEA